MNGDYSGSEGPKNPMVGLIRAVFRYRPLPVFTAQAMFTT
jgi:hypothetical protein